MIGADAIGSDSTIGNDCTTGADSITIGAATIGAEATGADTSHEQSHDPLSLERSFSKRQAFAVSIVIIKTMASTTVVLTVRGMLRIELSSFFAGAH